MKKLSMLYVLLFMVLLSAQYPIPRAKLDTVSTPKEDIDKKIDTLRELDFKIKNLDLLDTLKLMGKKTDSLNKKCKLKLTKVKVQQKTIVNQMDTLNNLTVKN